MHGGGRTPKHSCLSPQNSASAVERTIKENLSLSNSPPKNLHSLTSATIGSIITHIGFKMWLIRISDMKLVEFPYDPPPYAILSHTWGLPQDEVLFDDMVSGLESARVKEAFAKVENTCRLAQEQNLEYCWIDTCCIDKRSSAELQEAINSMFEWYKSSKVCYAYISDVNLSGCPSAPADNSEAEDSDGNWEDYNSDNDHICSRNSRDLDSVAYSEDSYDSERNSSNAEAYTSDGHFLDQFRQSRWFTRGWTLQELIAPAKVNFYDRDWELIGPKDKDLAPIIQSITGIPQDFLQGKRKHTEASVAQRMYWASSRETSRKEDIAYCLLGLFAINMPMLYGEGDNAFLRLQQEILNKIDDESIFAWLDVERNNDEAGLLAEHPRYFANSGDIVTDGILPSALQPIIRSDANPPAMTSHGLRLQKSVINLFGGLCIIPLRCTFQPGSSMADAHPTRHRVFGIGRGGFEASFVIGVLVCYSSYGDASQRVWLGEFLSTAIGHGLCGEPRTLFISRKRDPTGGYRGYYLGPLFRSRISSAVGYTLEPVPFTDRFDEEYSPQVMPVCITDLKLQEWATLVFTVQYGTKFKPYREPEEPGRESGFLEAQDGWIHPLLLRYNGQIVSTIWIGLHRKITKLLEEHRKLYCANSSCASNELAEYAIANPDTVILPGYNIEDRPNSSYSSRFEDGKYTWPHTWDIDCFHLCSKFYTKTLEVYSKPKQDVKIECEPISKTEWHSNPRAVFVVSPPTQLY